MKTFKPWQTGTQLFFKASDSHNKFGDFCKSNESFLCQTIFLQTHIGHPIKSKAAILWLWHLSVWGLGHFPPLPLIHCG